VHDHKDLTAATLPYLFDYFIAFREWLPIIIYEEVPEIDYIILGLFSNLKCLLLESKPAPG